MVSACHCRRRVRGGSWEAGDGERAAEAAAGKDPGAPRPGTERGLGALRCWEAGSPRELPSPEREWLSAEVPVGVGMVPLGGGAAASRSRDSPRRRRGILRGLYDCSLSLASLRPSAGVS